MGRQPLSPDTGLKKFQQAYAGYIAHPDPLMEAGNLLAFVIGTNQPFYPVYLLFIVGSGSWRALPLLASMPFFLAVPLLARRFPIGARLLLVLTSLANILLAVTLIGAQAGLAVLFIPCGAIAAILFRDRERPVMLAMVALAMAGWLVTNSMGPDVFSPSEYASLQRLNAMSAIGLCGVIGIALSGALRRIESGSASP